MRRTVLAVGVTVAALVGDLVAPGVAGADSAFGCEGWRLDTVVGGLDEPENLEPDSSGGFYVTGSSTLSHIDSAGTVRLLHDDLEVPRGLQLSGDRLYLVVDDGVSVMDIDTGEIARVVAAPAHGLLELPDGDLLTTRVGTEVGTSSKGITRIEPDTAVLQPNWSPVPRSEGLALGPDHRTVYTDDLFTGEIIRVPLDDPQGWDVVARLPGLLPGPDDLTMAADGVLYVAAHLDGSIQRVDPETGAVCAINSELPSGWAGPSSVRIGPYGDAYALYITVFDGTLRRLVPPDGVVLAPVAR